MHLACIAVMIWLVQSASGGGMEYKRPNHALNADAAKRRRLALR